MAGDAHAREFVAVYETDKRRLVRVAYAITSDREAAEDAVAEAVARCWPRFRDGRIDDLPGYLYRAVVNEAVAPRRRRLLHLRVQGRLAVPDVAPPADDRLGDSDLVWRALRTLPAGQRAALALRFLDDLSEAETARLLDVSVGTVKSRVSRALATLRESLEVSA